MKKEDKEKVDALTVRYQARLEKRVAEGLGLPGDGGRQGRLPVGITEENREAYVALRDQLRQLKDLRKNSVVKLREIIDGMEALKGAKAKPRKKAGAKKKKAS
jgi:hypothetical protein